MIQSTGKRLCLLLACIISQNKTDKNNAESATSIRAKISAAIVLLTILPIFLTAKLRVKTVPCHLQAIWYNHLERIHLVNCQMRSHYRPKFLSFPH